MNTALTILIIASLVNVFICLLVLLRNYKNPANVIFALDSIGLVCWASLNFLSTYLPVHATLATTRATGIVAALLLTGFYILSITFPNSLRPRKWFISSLLVVAAIVSLLSTTSLFVTDAIKTTAGLSIKEGQLYSLYPIFILSMFVICNVNFIRQFRHSQKLGRSQIKLMGSGFFLTVVLIILSNMIMPAVTENWSSSKLGTVFILPFVGLTAYAIIKRRMFDLRLVITRTIAYLITIGIVAGLYAFIVTRIATQLTSLGQLSANQVAALILPTIFIALTFHRLQQFIDRITKRIFYRDAYDEREVLDKLSDALITENDIEKIMQQSLAVLVGALRPSYAYLAVLNNSGNIYHHLSTNGNHPTEIESILHKLPRERQQLVDRDDNPNSPMAKILEKDEIDILLRFGPRSKPTGILLLGGKRNGTIYTKQDLALLRISAKNVGLSLDNAKKYEQIIHFADTLHMEVKRATSRLRSANERLKTLDSLKDDFIATASHQLRTPSASVHDALRMLKNPSMTPNDKAELLELAEASSEHLVTVVRTMLNMARLQAGHFTIDKSEAELVALTEKVIDQTTVLAAQKHSTIEFIKPSHKIIEQVDVAKINEALSNYIENAIKYSPDNSKITVSLQESDNSVLFEVSDQGMGVPAEEQKNLFGKFYRASNARNEQPDGNGIGLYVVKSIAEGHGGQAYFRPLPDYGSVFGLSFPRTVGTTKK